MGQAVVNQHQGAVGAVAHVVGIEIEVDDVLVVQRLHRAAQPPAEPADLVHRQRRAPRRLGELVAVNAFQQQVRLGGEIAAGDEFRHVRPVQAFKDTQFIFECRKA